MQFGSKKNIDSGDVYIIAEAGTTSNGDLSTALSLIDEAKDAGCDAIKFMMIDADFFMSDKTVMYDYEWSGGKSSENMYEMFKALEYTESEWLELRNKCCSVGLDFFITVDYMEGIDISEKMDLSSAYKLSSWDANNIPLIEKMAKTMKPILLDLGPACLETIERVVGIIEKQGNNQIIFLHCTHALNDSEVNMNTIPYLREKFGYPVGFSADTREETPDLLSLGLGASIIEKRITLDKDYAGHHHILGLEPKEMKSYVSKIRQATRLLGKKGVFPSSEDIKNRQKYFVSLVAADDIRNGMEITTDMICCKRPGCGIDPLHMDELVGKKINRKMKKDELFEWGFF